MFDAPDPSNKSWTSGDKKLPDEPLMQSLKPEVDSIPQKNFEYNGKSVKREPNKVQLKLLNVKNTQNELWLEVEAYSTDWHLEWYLFDGKKEDRLILRSNSEQVPSPSIYTANKPFVLQKEVLTQYITNLKQNGYETEWIEQKAKPALLMALYFIAENYEELFYDMETFEHLYESEVKREAEKAFETGPMDVFLETIQRFHKGDEPEIQLMVLAEFAAHITNGQSVPIFIKGSPDGGKSSLNNAVHRIIPKRFLRKYTSLSQKSAYYNSTVFRTDYNKLVVNDILDSPDIMGFLKSWADNEEDVMRHTTVIKGEGAILEVEGRRGISITAADQIHDKQLNRRFLHLNPQESSQHKKDTKKFIKNSEMIGNTGEHDKEVRLCQAIYDKIIERNFSVYNPFIDGLKQKEFANTELKHLINIIKAQTIMNRGNRVEFADGWLLGTEDDVRVVVELWHGIKSLQDTYLPQKAFEMLEKIPERDEDSETDKNAISISGIVEKTGIPRQTVRDFLWGVDDRLGLKDLGKVKTIKKDPDNLKSMWLLYRPISSSDHNGDNESKNRDEYYTPIKEKSVVKSFWNITTGKVGGYENIPPEIIGISTDYEVKTTKSVLKIIRKVDKELKDSGKQIKLELKEFSK